MKQYSEDAVSHYGLRESRAAHSYCPPSALAFMNCSFNSVFSKKGFCEEGASYLVSLTVAYYDAHLTIENGLSLL